jgi:hypothetical protein
VAFLPRRAVRDPSAQLEEQAGLADARLADDERHLPASCPRALERVDQRAQLALASHERREPAAVGFHLEARPRLVRGDNLPRGDGLGFALEVKLAERPRLEVAADETIGRLRDRDTSRLTRLLQTRRHVGRVSHRGVVHAQVAADAADHDEAGVEALARAEADAAGSQPGLIALERPSDAKRGVDGPARVVLMGDGGTEQRHDAVAQELVDRALVAVHLGQHEVEGPAHEPVDFLGVETLGQRGEA